ncbi:hypothetical protein [Oligella urethralis]|uniref:hypothetical protein n=1 Tax=Oligella urethralis TaxID=90245 RepID=UPI002433012C|nr:hypothetical protein [Oligella urethralis]
MKKILIILLAVTLTACATHKPAAEPKGEFFPINAKPLVPEKIQLTGGSNA